MLHFLYRLFLALVLTCTAFSASISYAQTLETIFDEFEAGALPNPRRPDDMIFFKLYLMSRFGHSGRFSIDDAIQNVGQKMLQFPNLSKQPFSSIQISAKIKTYARSELAERTYEQLSTIARALVSLDVNDPYWRGLEDVEDVFVSAGKHFLKKYDGRPNSMSMIQNIIRIGGEYGARNFLPYLFRALDDVASGEAKRIQSDIAYTYGLQSEIFHEHFKKADGRQQIAMLQSLLQDQSIEFLQEKMQRPKYKLNQHASVHVGALLVQLQKESSQLKLIRTDGVEYIVRQLSLAESPFRSLLAADCCATETYLEKALESPYQYFTSKKNGELRWTSHVTVVLGNAKEGDQNLKTAMIDKIQSVDLTLLPYLIESVRRSMLEKGYLLGIPVDLGDNNGLSNDSKTREFIQLAYAPYTSKRIVSRFSPEDSSANFTDFHDYTRANDHLDVVILSEFKHGEYKSIPKSSAKTIKKYEFKKILENILNLKHGDSQKKADYVRTFLAWSKDDKSSKYVPSSFNDDIVALFSIQSVYLRNVILGQIYSADKIDLIGKIFEACTKLSSSGEDKTAYSQFANGLQNLVQRRGPYPVVKWLEKSGDLVLKDFLKGGTLIKSLLPAKEASMSMHERYYKFFIGNKTLYAFLFDPSVKFLQKRERIATLSDYLKLGERAEISKSQTTGQLIASLWRGFVKRSLEVSARDNNEVFKVLENFIFEGIFELSNGLKAEYFKEALIDFFSRADDFFLNDRSHALIKRLFPVHTMDASEFYRELLLNDVLKNTVVMSEEFRACLELALYLSSKSEDSADQGRLGENFLNHSPTIQQSALLTVLKHVSREHFVKARLLLNSDRMDPMPIAMWHAVVEALDKRKDRFFEPLAENVQDLQGPESLRSWRDLVYYLSHGYWHEQLPQEAFILEQSHNKMYVYSRQFSDLFFYDIRYKDFSFLDDGSEETQKSIRRRIENSRGLYNHDSFFSRLNYASRDNLEALLQKLHALIRQDIPMQVGNISRIFAPYKKVSIWKADLGGKSELGKSIDAAYIEHIQAVEKKLLNMIATRRAWALYFILKSSPHLSDDMKANVLAFMGDFDLLLKTQSRDYLTHHFYKPGEYAHGMDALERFHFEISALGILGVVDWIQKNRSLPYLADASDDAADFKNLRSTSVIGWVPEEISVVESARAIEHFFSKFAAEDYALTTHLYASIRNGEINRLRQVLVSSGLVDPSRIDDVISVFEERASESDGHASSEFFSLVRTLSEFVDVPRALWDFAFYFRMSYAIDAWNEKNPDNAKPSFDAMWIKRIADTKPELLNDLVKPIQNGFPFKPIVDWLLAQLNAAYDAAKLAMPQATGFIQSVIDYLSSLFTSPPSAEVPTQRPSIAPQPVPAPNRSNPRTRAPSPPRRMANPEVEVPESWMKKALRAMPPDGRERAEAVARYKKHANTMSPSAAFTSAILDSTRLSERFQKSIREVDSALKIHETFRLQIKKWLSSSRFDFGKDAVFTLKDYGVSGTIIHQIDFLFALWTMEVVRELKQEGVSLTDLDQVMARAFEKITDPDHVKSLVAFIGASAGFPIAGRIAMNRNLQKMPVHLVGESSRAMATSWLKILGRFGLFAGLTAQKATTQYLLIGKMEESVFARKPFNERYWKADQSLRKDEDFDVPGLLPGSFGYIENLLSLKEPAPAIDAKTFKYTWDNGEPTVIEGWALAQKPRFNPDYSVASPRKTYDHVFELKAKLELMSSARRLGFTLSDLDPVDLTASFMIVTVSGLVSHALLPVPVLGTLAMLSMAGSLEGWYQDARYGLFDENDLNRWQLGLGSQWVQLAQASPKLQEAVRELQSPLTPHWILGHAEIEAENSEYFWFKMRLEAQRRTMVFQNALKRVLDCYVAMLRKANYRESLEAEKDLMSELTGKLEARTFPKFDALAAGRELHRVLTFVPSSNTCKAREYDVQRLGTQIKPELDKLFCAAAALNRIPEILSSFPHARSTLSSLESALIMDLSLRANLHEEGKDYLAWAVETRIPVNMLIQDQISTMEEIAWSVLSAPRSLFAFLGTDAAEFSRTIYVSAIQNPEYVSPKPRDVSTAMPKPPTTANIVKLSDEDAYLVQVPSRFKSAKVYVTDLSMRQEIYAVTLPQPKADAAYVAVKIKRSDIPKGARAQWILLFSSSGEQLAKLRVSNL